MKLETIDKLIEIIYVKSTDFNLEEYKRDKIVCIIVPVGCKESYYIDKTVPLVIKELYEQAYHKFMGYERTLSTNAFNNAIYAMAICVNHNDAQNNYIRLVDSILDILGLYEFNVIVDYKINKAICATNFEGKTSLDVLSLYGETETFEELLYQNLKQILTERSDLNLKNKIIILDYTDYNDQDNEPDIMKELL